jgi:hypothetical protein
MQNENIVETSDHQSTHTTIISDINMKMKENQTLSSTTLMKKKNEGK